MRFLITAALAFAFALPARASDRCWLISNVAATSIAGGAITTAALKTSPGASVGRSSFPIPAKIKIGVDLVDGDSGVSDLTLTFTGAEATAGTDRAVGERDGDSSAALTRSWDPTALGKNRLVIVALGVPLFKITVTPTGEGAGDTVALAVYGCTSGE